MNNGRTGAIDFLLSRKPLPANLPSEASMQHVATATPNQSLHFNGADLEIRAQLGGRSLTIDIVKSGARVHRVTINDAVGPLEHGWIAALFAREDRVELGKLAGEVGEYVDGLNINQG